MVQALKFILTTLLVLIVLLLAVSQLKNEKTSKVIGPDLEVATIPIQKSGVNYSTKNIKQNDVNSETIIVCDTPVVPDDLITAKDFNADSVELPIQANSMEMESQIANVLIFNSGDIKDSIKRLRQLKTKFSDNTLLSYDLLSSCTVPESECDDSIFKNGVSLESQNGAVWLLSAINEINSNNIDAAISALLEASSTPYYEGYWGDHLALFQEVFNQSGVENSLPTQSDISSYIASVPLPNFGPLVNFCKNIDADRADVLDACLNIGLRLSNGEGTSLTHLIGLSLRKVIYERYNDSAQVEQTAIERAKFMKIVSQSDAANALVWQSRQRTSDLIQRLKDFGEVAATEYIVEQAIRLSSDPDFDPCAVDW